MPYQIQSRCAACQQGDIFLIGDWTRYYGVYACATCHKLVNIAVTEGTCPGCGVRPAVADYYDYAASIPYLGGQSPHKLAPGPDCLRCGQATLTFENQAHLNMGSVVHNEADAKTTWGMDYMEKAIFMNSAVPVMQEFNLNPAKVFAYFHLHLPDAPLVTRRVSYPIYLDIRTHLMTKRLMQPDQFQ
ncbi:MAG: hypothetical protein CL610_12490 [Anaerolineaceae bacterium]|nr:hypothetical protein [Anaerolineaceae bacterium]